MMNSSPNTDVAHQRPVVDIQTFEASKEDIFWTALAGHDFSFIDDIDGMALPSYCVSASEESPTTKSLVTPSRRTSYREVIDRLTKDRDHILRRNVRLESQLCEANATVKVLHNELEKVKANHEKQIAFLLYDYENTPCTGRPKGKKTILGPVDHNIVENHERAGDYIIGKFLGEGQFGEVFHGTHRKTKKECAIKCFKNHKIRSPHEMRQLEREVMVLKTMDHPNIISLHQIIHAPSIVYVAMELGSMDLYDYSRGVHFDDVALRQIMLGIVKGLDYLHFQGICHMDIKSENVMVMKDVPADQLTQEHIKLCDFGLCSVASSDQGDDDGAVYHTGMKGSPCYFAPEMVLHGDEHTFDCRPADMWSAAVTLLNLCEEVPVGWIQAYDCAMAGDIGMFRKGIQHILKMFHDDDYFEENSAFDLIRRLLRMDPKARLSASQCLNHGWLDEDSEEDDDDSDDEEDNSSLSSDDMSM